jgi:predicted NBD/HSP70 family sugar kinase
VSSAGERGLAVASSEEIFADREAHGVLLAEILDAFTHLITLIALSYEPQSVLLTGGLSDSFDDTTLARIGAEVERSVGVKTSVRRSSMGDAAGLLGALSLALSQLYTEMGIAHDDATIRNRRDDIVAAFRAHPPHGSAGAAASPSGAAAS